MMKKRWFLFMVTLLVFAQSFAIPAHPGSVKVTQPDGSFVTIRLHGDEYLNYTTTVDGYSVVKNAQGAYVYARLDADGQLAPTAIMAHDAADRKVAEKAYLQGVKKNLVPVMTEQSRQMMKTNRARMAQARQAVATKAPKYDYNNFRGLVILVEYNDKPFSRSDYQTIMNDMINKENYTGYTNTNDSKEEYTGSVRDYYADNSNGKFKPQFDVYGPYKINYSQYDAQKTDNSFRILKAAIEAADADVNFKNYDRDGNGAVDLIYFIMAGNGSNFGGNDSRLWWPHRSVLYGNGYIIKDGVYLWDYASSVELYGFTSEPSTVVIDGIGTICHEFSHVLGLPDFYDADYAGSGGASVTPDGWSIMAGGSYNNNGRNPVGYSLFERYAVGFATPQTISAEGSYTLENLSTCNTGYRINTLNPKEFFFLENRQKDKWNSYLPGHGMLVFRVDSTSTEVWEQNAVNNDPSHNYYQLLRAAGYTGKDSGSDPFPGTKKVRSLSPSSSPAKLMSWSGDPAYWALEKIAESSGNVTFNVVNAIVLKSVTLPPSVTVNKNFSVKLDAVCTPAYALKSLKWESENPAVAKVNQEGIVTGVAVGNTTIKVTANESLVATCAVTVEEAQAIETIAAFKQMGDGKEGVLRLNNAQVLFVYDSNVYVRDASGYIVLVNTNLDVKQNDVVNGLVYGKVVIDNGVYQLVGDETIIPTVEAVAGEPAQARVVSLSDVSETDYSDLIVLSGVQMKKTSYLGLSGVYVVDGEKYVRIFNTFGLTKQQLTMPSNYTKLYDITGILTPRVQGSDVIMELGVVKSPVEHNPSGIQGLSVGTSDGKPVYYTLSGRRVENVNVPGIYIMQQGGTTRKLVVR